MATPKKSSKKTTAKTSAKVTPKVEEKPKPEAQSYLVPIAFQREPIEKDIPVADMFYHKSSNSFTLQCHAPQHEAHIEMIVEGDISIEESGNIKMISKSESPVSWITNLNKSREFSGNPFIAGEVQEIYEA
jgi:hypothetical protein|tara:strand:+ start:188 stop:580 length:393 start_codon:yes stop_codon:yes gene_type:complete